MAWPRNSLVVLTLVCSSTSAFAQRQFGFDNTKPSGQEYLSPEESLKRLKVPPGWEVKLVAAEPDVVNPIAFSIDERGRLWVLECFEYPKRTPKGSKPRDRIKIIEENPGGRPKVTIWAAAKDLPTGWDLASGLEVGHGGVFLGAPPYLFFLQDTDGDGKCDKQEILLKGFGSQDTHETLNTFQWGPDSKLYGLHGVFTHSEVDGVKMNAAVWRYAPSPTRRGSDPSPPGRGAGVRGKFDIFAEGTSNPWGMDFDQHGQCFLACCVIPHLFHMVPGGTYKRQAGSSFNPYAYGLLNEICDHEHHKQSGWAHAGLICLDGSHVPQEYRRNLLMGSIHGCSIKRDVLRASGSTYIGSCAPDFLVSDDKNFRPINLRWGPDGSIYVIDWHDQNPCHQAKPDSWDYTRGRIYKIQRAGAQPAAFKDLSQATGIELVRTLTNDNPYWYRTALRLLSERRDKSLANPLRDLALNTPLETHALRGLWGLYAIGAFDDASADKLLRHRSPFVRAWTIRLLGEPGEVSRGLLDQLTRLSETDRAPQVQLQLASTAGRLKKQDTLPLLHHLLQSAHAKDAYLPLMIWLAYEPRVTAQRAAVLDWLKRHASDSPVVTSEIVWRTMRRLAVSGKDADLDACIAFLGEVPDTEVRRRALEGLLQAFQNRQIDAPPSWPPVFAQLLKVPDADVQERARKLAVHLQDPEAIARALAMAQDTTLALTQRTDALRDLAVAHPPRALPVLREMLQRDKSPQIRAEICRALAAYDDVGIAAVVLNEWKSFPPLVRGEAVSLLASRKLWAKGLLAAVGRGEVPRTDLTDNTILRIRAFKDKGLDDQIQAVWGRFRDTPKELGSLIDKMRGELATGKASFARGKIVFDNQCAKCHKFDGRGHDVGPNLDGAARDIEYLLANILDPNRVVGQPYYVRTIELKNGRIETGLLVAEDDQSVTIKAENDVVKVIQRKDIEGKILVQEKSIMPEGLANNMTVQDFRDLIRYTMAHPFLTEVSIAGPFTGRQEFSPFDPANPLATKGVAWKRPVVGPLGRIPLPPIKETAGWTYVVAEVNAKEPVRTRLQLGAVHSVQVLVNGKSVYTGRLNGKEPAPDQAAHDVELRRGINRLVFQVTYQGGNEVLYTRLLDPERKLDYPEPE